MHSRSGKGQGAVEQATLRRRCRCRGGYIDASLGLVRPAGLIKLCLRTATDCGRIGKRKVQLQLMQGVGVAVEV